MRYRAEDNSHLEVQDSNIPMLKRMRTCEAQDNPEAEGNWSEWTYWFGKGDAPASTEGRSIRWPEESRPAVPFVDSVFTEAPERGLPDPSLVDPELQPIGRLHQNPVRALK